MHPILSQRRALWVYLALWAVLAAIPVAIVALPEGGLWGSTTLLTLPTTLIFAMATLPTWYLCKAMPLNAATLLRLVVAHSLAATFWSTLWTVALVFGAALLSWLAELPALSARLDQRATALWTMGVLFYLLVAAFQYLLIAQEDRQASERRQAALSATAQQAELRALRAQVHPHFLFNSLNTVSALVGRDPAQARQACVLLAEYLRGTLGAAEQNLVPLRQELELARRYLGVEKLRLGERLRVEEDVAPEVLDFPVPSLLLQPLIENAVTHGVVPLDAPAPVLLRARQSNDRLLLTLQNSVDPAPRPRPPGVGLANVQARLHAHYGRDADLRVERAEGVFCLSVSLPRQAGAT